MNGIRKIVRLQPQMIVTEIRTKQGAGVIVNVIRKIQVVKHLHRVIVICIRTSRDVEVIANVIRKIWIAKAETIFPILEIVI